MGAGIQIIRMIQIRELNYLNSQMGPDIIQIIQIRELNYLNSPMGPGVQTIQIIQNQGIEMFEF